MIREVSLVIVAPTDTGYRLVTQPDHAELAGTFARHWGSERFREPEPRGAVLTATDLHDDGWISYDRHPCLNSAGKPIGFTEVPPTTWIQLYDDGINAVIEIDSYAGLLVSMHGTGLRRRRYGLSPSWTDTPAPFEGFVEDQEAEQRELIKRMLEHGDNRITRTDHQVVSRLHAKGHVDDPNDSLVWTNYKLLQAWDSLSLAFCTSVTGPTNQRISNVPRQPRGDDVTLVVKPQGNTRFSIDPYPFKAQPLNISLRFREVRESEFETDFELLTAYYRAELQRTELTLVPPD